MDPTLWQAVGRTCGSVVSGASRMSGGDINEAYRVSLADGRSVFVKTHSRADPRMFVCEARGLEWLAAARAIRVPDVIGVGDDSTARPGYLVLEFITPARRAPDFDARLGRGLATLHRHGAAEFGLTYDNFIGSLPQDNRSCATWPTFYLSRRLEPQVRRAIESGAATSDWGARLDRLGQRLERLVGDPEAPARLHGDLWSGNVHTDNEGGPCLIDPAVYGGHREIDLAMLSLFGNPGPRCWAAYDEVYPRAPGAAERLPLYQLYPLLVHVNLFGGDYGRAVEATLARYA